MDGLSINPINNAKYIRTDVGGIFTFDNINQKRINLFDNLISINQRDISSVESFAIDKSTSGNNQVIYALSGNYGYKSYLLKSINKGQTWTINQGWDENRKVFGKGGCRGAWYGDVPNNLSKNQIEIGSEKLVIYPNPTQDYFYLKFADSENNKNTQLEITDFLGRKIKTIKIEDINTKIATNMLKKSTYIVNLTSNNRNYTTKLVVE